MPTATKEAKTAAVANVHHMVRAIGSAHQSTDLGEEIFSVDEVNAHVQNWLDDGYTLHSTHFVGNARSAGAGSPTVGYRMLYIFVKDA